MILKSLLLSLVRYKAAADDELLDAVRACADTADPTDHAKALRLLNHVHIVDRIFRAHLTGVAHGYTAEAPPVPPIATLAEAIRATDRWYVDHVAASDPASLDEPIAFTFTDGQAGRMTRAEILAHVVTHAGYHRGEIGRLLPGVGAASERDVFAGHLHRAEPARRMQASAAVA